MEIKIVVWNMHAVVDNWAVLAEDPDLSDADVYLLCEATPWEGRLPKGLYAKGHGSTRGIGCQCEGPGCDNRTYSTAIASPYPLEDMPERTRRDTYYRRHLPFEPSRAGTWTAALVDLGEFKLTAISLYGLNDEAYDASVHRSLSELSPVFDRKPHAKRLVLGGDLNILPTPPRSHGLDRSQVVMERIRAYGLTDCYQRARPPGPGPEAERCTCGMGEACTHTRTFFRPDSPGIPYQDDYLFASKDLVRGERLVSCDALPVDSDSPSDHAPLLATFNI